ncbi:hypothetical protein ACU686_09145 [Yinghuangia aomiensis]
MPTAANSPWAYLIVFTFAVSGRDHSDRAERDVADRVRGVRDGDGVLPPNLFLLIALGGLGAWLGDNTVYALGRWAEPFATKHLLSGERGKKARQRAEGWPAGLRRDHHHRRAVHPGRAHGGVVDGGHSRLSVAEVPFLRGDCGLFVGGGTRRCWGIGAGRRSRTIR